MTSCVCPVGLPSGGTGDIAAFTAQNFSPSPIVATLTVTPNLNGCNGPAQTFTITVNPIPTIDMPMNQTVCAGNLTQPIVFTGLVPSTVYAWSYSNPPGKNIGLPFSGTGDIAAFTAVNTTGAAIVSTFTVEPDAFGCTCGEMDFTITVNPKPGMNQPANRPPVCAGTGISSINFTGAPAGTAYLWTNSEPGIGLAASGTGNIAGFISTNTTGANLVASITVTPVLNDCPGTPKTFTITVKPTPMVNFCSSIFYCPGELTMPMTFVSGVPGATISWTNNKSALSGIGLAASGTGDLPAFTATNTTANALPAIIGVKGTLNGCTGMTTSFTITVKPAPKVNTVAHKAPVCHGASVSATNFVGTAGASFHWTNSDPSIGLAASGVGSIGAFEAQNTGTAIVVATIVVKPFLNGCYGATRSFTITVKPKPTVDDFAYMAEVCAGDGLPAVPFTGSVPGTTFTWTNNKSALTGIGLAANGTAGLPAFVAVNTLTTGIPALLKITPKANGCTGTVLSKTLTVKPLPTVAQPMNQTVLVGEPTDPVYFTGLGLSLEFDWVNDNPDIGLAASGTGNILAFFAQNPTGGPISANITVTPTAANGCTGTPKTFSITVLIPTAKPAAGDDRAEALAPQTVEPSATFALHQNVPNPFVGETTVRFYLSETMPSTVSIWDQTGVLLFRKEDVFPAGENAILLNANDLGTSRVLVCRLETPLGVAVRQMLRTE